MPKYKVTVSRTETREHTFIVEADNTSMAYFEGMEAAFNHDFHEDSANVPEYAQTNIEDVK